MERFTTGLFNVIESCKMLAPFDTAQGGLSDSRRPEAAPVSVRMVNCVKLKKPLPGLPAPPWPGELGQRIFDNVSADAWAQWEERMKMILNEYKLLPFQKEAQLLVAKYMEDYFFGNESAATPPGYVPEQK